MAEPKAYAKLWWRDHNPFYIQGLKATIGRSSHSDILLVRFTQEEDKKVSRKHALIYWDESLESFILKCLSKNGMVVNSKFLMQDQEFKLFSKCPILIGDNKFYFLLPKKLEEIPLQSITDIFPIDKAIILPPLM